MNFPILADNHTIVVDYNMGLVSLILLIELYLRLVHVSLIWRLRIFFFLVFFVFKLFLKPSEAQPALVVSGQFLILLHCWSIKWFAPSFVLESAVVGEELRQANQTCSFVKALGNVLLILFEIGVDIRCRSALHNAND